MIVLCVVGSVDIVASFSPRSTVTGTIVDECGQSLESVHVGSSTTRQYALLCTQEGRLEPGRV